MTAILTTLIDWLSFKLEFTIGHDKVEIIFGWQQNNSFFGALINACWRARPTRSARFLKRHLLLTTSVKEVRRNGKIDSPLDHFFSNISDRYSHEHALRILNASFLCFWHLPENQNLALEQATDAFLKTIYQVVNQEENEKLTDNARWIAWLENALTSLPELKCCLIAYHLKLELERQLKDYREFSSAESFFNNTVNTARQYLQREILNGDLATLLSQEEIACLEEFATGRHKWRGGLSH